jgi:predicted Zn-dependent peptidase
MEPVRPEIHTLDNGMRVVVEPMPGARSAVMVFRFAFGAKDDPIDRLGLTRIAEDTSFKGTPVKDAHAIFDAFDNLGVRRGSATGVEYTEFQAQLLPRHFREVLALYCELFRTASFPDDQVEVAKALTLEELKRLEDNPAQQVLYLTHQAGLGDPMGRVPLGSPETVAAISAAGVRNHWAEQCHPGRIILSVAGGLDAAEVLDAAAEVLGEWPDGGQAEEAPPRVSVAARSVHHPKQSEQAHIGMVFGAVPRGHDLYYAGNVAVSVLSGGGSSRLFTEVREKRGLAYSVGAFYRARRGGGLISLYAGTTADRADETVSVCREEIQRLGRDVTQEELNRAKTVIGGRLFTTGDLPEGRAGSLAEDVFLEGKARSVDEIAAGVNRVSLDQIPAYLEAFPPAPLAQVALGPKPLSGMESA